MDTTASEPSSPRSRQLQGKRPPRLGVNAESLKIKKPAVTPRPKKSHHLQQPPASAHVISVEPADFVACVQRFAAGPELLKFKRSPSVQFPPRDCLLSLTTAAVSASTRLPATERAVRPPLPLALLCPPTDYGADADSSAAVLSLPRRPGILSPAALPPAACSGQFSPMPFDPSCLPQLKELSPFFLSAASRCVEELGCLSTLNPSTLLPGVPCPATGSTPMFFSNVPEI